MRLLLLALLALVLAAPAVAAPRPETPSGKPGKITRHSYWYRAVWYATDGTPIRVSCHVQRLGTLCYVRSIG